MKKVLALDLGATNLRVGLFEEKNLKKKLKVKTEKNQPVEQIIEILKKETKEIDAIGLGIPGPLNLKEGFILNPPNLPNLRNTPLKKILEDKFKKPIFLDNDANCALLGEKWQGAAKNYKNVVMLTLGTGIGGAVLINGEIYRGATGAGAELGHMIIKSKFKMQNAKFVDQNSIPKCRCGQYGCLESLASARAITQKTGKLAVFIFEKAKKGDKESLLIIKEASYYLAVGLISLYNIFEPEIFILGGGLSSAWKFLDFIKEEVKKTSNKKIVIKKAKLSEWAGIYGAAKGAIDKISNY
jgi:glucokinase